MWRLGVWRFMHFMRGARKCLCLLYSESQDATPIMLRCSETADWIVKIKCEKWINLYEEIFFNKTVNCEFSTLTSMSDCSKLDICGENI
jgi:hypothetical protein